jgi:hypothetical protein
MGLIVGRLHRRRVGIAGLATGTSLSKLFDGVTLARAYPLFGHSFGFSPRRETLPTHCFGPGPTDVKVSHDRLSRKTSTVANGRYHMRDFRETCLSRASTFSFCGGKLSLKHSPSRSRPSCLGCIVCLGRPRFDPICLLRDPCTISQRSQRFTDERRTRGTRHRTAALQV